MTKAKKNILIISPFIPFPLNSGGNVAQFSIDDNLRHEYNLHLLFPVDRPSDIENLKILQSKWENVSFYSFRETFFFKLKRFLFQKLPTIYADFFAIKSLEKEEITEHDKGIFKSLRVFRMASLYIDSSFLKLIKEITESNSIDIVQVEFCDFLPLGSFLPSKVCKIFVHHELEYIRNARVFQLMDKSYSFIDYILLKNRGIELSLLDAYDKIITLSNTDKGVLNSFSLDSKLVESPVPLRLKETLSSSLFTFNNSITFLGGETHFPNKDAVLWFVSEVWQELKSTYPDLKLTIIGSWSDDTINSFKVEPSIEFKGFVPDLAEELKNSIFIVPIRIGSGIRMKIIEAINIGCPVVSTTIGIEGLDFQATSDFLLSDTAEEFIRNIELLINDSGLCRTIIEQAKESMNAKYSFSKLISKRFDIYESV